MALWNYLVYFGMTLLIHSVISAVQYISVHGPVSLPADIAFECVVGCLLSAFAYVKKTGTGEWKEISLPKAYSSLSWESIEYRPQFIHYNHRGKVLHK